MIAEPVISLKDVRKSYGNFELGPVDLEIEPGYVVAVVGPNGSGKSTLFKMLMNLAHPDQGSLSLFGGAYPDDEVEIKRRIGYVPERPVGHGEMSAKALGGFVSRWYPTWNERRYRELIERSEIEPDKQFRNLSKGMQRRLAFALAAATDTDLLLLDEPTDGVDPFARREMLEDISRFVGDGERTVVFATHIMDEVRRVADYVAFLVNGEFLSFYEKDALLDNWRTVWVDRRPGEDTPGVIEAEDGTPVRLVSNAPEATSDALKEQGVTTIRTAPLDLEEILWRLMREKKREPAGGR